MIQSCVNIVVAYVGEKDIGGVGGRERERWPTQLEQFYGS